MDPPAFVVVRDLAAPWPGLVLPDGTTPGLLLLAAGPTDEGCRTIEVWASAAAYRNGDWGGPDLLVPPVVRTFHAPYLVSRYLASIR